MPLAPHVLIMDKLRSYKAAKAEVMPGVESDQAKWHNNRAEHAHQPTRLAREGDAPVQVSRSWEGATYQPVAPVDYISEWEDICTGLLVTEN